MTGLAEMRQQILDNFYFHAILETDPYIIISKDSAGCYQAWVIDKSANQVDSLSGEVAATSEDALQKLFDKSCEQVQEALDEASLQARSISDAST
ncbi:unnamed protein product [Aureobasidium mustum]|uniref:Uncharacterized protein n=1 Tax=Aureobasidium mustum TaxID=2773714 RepID=A0A9N8K299_9PEZI|nr:unnamed protein product [Aureobasidium mustum]